MSLHLVIGCGLLFHNHLLCGLSAATREVLRPRLSAVELAPGDLLQEQGRPKTRSYFIESGLVAIIRLGSDGSRSQAAMVGREGLVGGVTGVVLGASAINAEVQTPGTAFAIPTRELGQLAREHGELSLMLAHYAQLLLDEARMAAACNATHALSARLAKWLLFSMDRSGDPVLRITHQSVSEFLSIQRTTATETLRRLADAGLIRNGRGRIEILDAHQLRGVSCSCYDDVNARFAELGMPRPGEALSSD